MKSLRGLDLKMASSICSSSKQRALKPDRGWLLRQMAAWGEAKGTQASHRNVYLSWHFRWIIALDEIKKREKNHMWESGWIACSIWINQPHNFSFVHLVATRERARERCVILPPDSWTKVETLCPIRAPHSGPSTLGSWPRTHKALPTVQSRINRTD